MKKTTDEKFVHVICALFVSETEFANNEIMEPVNISKVKAPKNNATCVFCKGLFGTFKCAAKKCKKNLHASCGFENGSLKEELDDENLIKFVGYCDDHISYIAENKKAKRLSSDNLKQAVVAKVSRQLKSTASKQNSEWLREKVNLNESLALQNNDQNNSYNTGTNDDAAVAFGINEPMDVDNSIGGVSVCVDPFFPMAITTGLGTDGDIENDLDRIRKPSTHTCYKDQVLAKVSSQISSA